MDRKTIKQNAKEMIKGNKLQFLLIVLITFGISVGVAIIGVMAITIMTAIVMMIIPGDKVIGMYTLSMIINLISSIISFVLSAAANMSICYASLNVYDVGVCNISEFSYGYRNIKQAWGIFWRQGVFTYLWSLLFVIPGIIKSISYSQAMYIALDNPDMSSKECIKMSMDIMKGNKIRYIIMGLSFIGWSLLIPVTLGLISIWLYPYILVSYAGFYRELANNLNYDS